MSAASTTKRTVMAVLCAALCAAAAIAVPPGDGAFGSAAVVPMDASVVVRLRDAHGLRSDASMLPAQAALLRLAGSRVLVQTWDRLAADLGVDPSELVDRFIGADATYAERTRDGRVEWAVVTRIDQAFHDLLVEKLKPAVAAGGRATFPVQQVTTVWRPPYLVLGPADRAALMEDVAARIDAEKPDGSLRGASDLAPALGWEPAPVEIVWQHAAPVGGMTVLSVRSADGQLRVRHRSRFDRAPLHVASGAAADAGLLRALEGAGIAALVMNPWRGTLDEGEPIDAFLAEGGFDGAMRANIGARQVVVLGDVPLDGTRVRVPTLGLAFEVRDPVLAEKQWDGWAQRFAESVSRRVAMPVPERGPAEPGAPRIVEIGPAVRSLFADHPFAQPVRLAWASLSSPNGAWEVLASDPALLQRMSTAIASAERSPDPDEANELGVLATRTLAAHLRSWTSQPALFVPEAPEPFMQAVSLAADIAGAAQRVRWRARAPVEGVVESEIVVELPARATAPPAKPAPPAGAAAP